MVQGKTPRMGSRRSSTSYCSTLALISFIALCLFGAWMMSSTTMVPVDLSTRKTSSDTKELVSGNDAPSNPAAEDKQKEDTYSSENFPESNKTAYYQSESFDEKTDEIKDQEGRLQNLVTEVEVRKDNLEGASKGQSYGDENGETRGGEGTNDGGGIMGDGTDGGGLEEVKNLNSTGYEKEETGGGEGNNDGGGIMGDGTDGGGLEEVKNLNSTGYEKEETGGGEGNNDGGGIMGDGTDGGGLEEVKNLNSTGYEKEGTLGQTERISSNNRPQEEGENNSSAEVIKDEKRQGEVEPKVEETEPKKEQNAVEKKHEEQSPTEMILDPTQAELLNQTRALNISWSTQATESKKEQEVQKPSDGQLAEYRWKLCNVSAGSDYIPCLDNIEAILKLRTTKHYEHRERHCPEEGPTCLVPFPEGYKQPIKWPESRNKIWYANVPHMMLAEVKGHQNWIKVTGEYLTFPGGGTQFIHGALHYIDFMQEALPEIAWGRKTRVVLDVGCGVASFGGFLFDRDVITMSFAPKDEHEAQVQFALERGIPAFSAVMGTKRLPFPSAVFDVVHCARCRVPWEIEGGKLLLELNRLMRPGGYFLWSATPVYLNEPDDNEIWEAMSKLTKSMCWEIVAKTKDTVNKVGIAIYKKPSSNECYEKRPEDNPPLCQDSDDPNAAWNVKLQACMHRVPVDPLQRGSRWPDQWPKRLETPPYWLNSSQLGVYGQAVPEDFKSDYEHWKRVVSKSYLTGMGINWSNVRNAMDMRSVYGGFAAALRDINVWVMNVVSIDSADTLPIICERGLIGMYHDWCESFSTYPRTYDLLHADHLFSKVKTRCKLLLVMAEVDRILRPEGKIIVRDNAETINEVQQIAKSLHWEIQITYSKKKRGLLSLQKTTWRPDEVESTSI